MAVVFVVAVEADVVIIIMFMVSAASVYIDALLTTMRPFKRSQNEAGWLQQCRG